MKNGMLRVIAVLLVCAMMLSLAACASVSDAPKDETIKNETGNGPVITPVTDEDSQGDQLTSVTKGSYTEGVVLVKVKERFDAADLGTLEHISAEPL